MNRSIFCIFKKFVGAAAVAALSIGVVSCAAPQQTRAVGDATLGGPVSGPIIINTVIPVKDYEVMGIIAVRSEVKVERVSQSREVRTGSPVTYEMLMLEAQKLGADDIMNIRRDVYVQETRNNYNRVTSTTYTHTATAIAIKYTDAMPFCDPRMLMSPRSGNPNSPQATSRPPMQRRSAQHPANQNQAQQQQPTPVQTSPAQPTPIQQPQNQPQQNVPGGVEW